MKPILFSPPMVKAILDGKKTMTRRAVRNDPCFKGWECTVNESYDVTCGDKGDFWFLVAGDMGYAGPVKCPYGEVGDILWVKEAFYAWGHWETTGVTKTGKVKRQFVYDSKEVHFEKTALGSMPSKGFYRDDVIVSCWHKRNSLFMPKWTSRIQLEITKVRCERLQDITEEDAKNEGVTLDGPVSYIPACQNSPYVYHFSYLWDSINGYGSFGKNPWVFVIEFRRVK